MALADFFADTSEHPHPVLVLKGLTRIASGSWAEDMPDLPTGRESHDLSAWRMFKHI